MAFITLVLCIVGLIILTGALSEKSINVLQFFGGLIFATTTLYIDIRWIDKHFDGEEWV